MNTLDKYITQVRGISYKPEEISELPLEDYVPILKANNIKETGLDESDLIYIHRSKIKPEQFIRKGDLLLAASSGSKEIVGKHIFFDKDYQGSFGAFCKVVRPKENIYPEFVSAFFKTPTYRRHIRKVIQGANINNLRNEHIANLVIADFTLPEQIRIATVLNKAEILVLQRKENIDLLDNFLKSTFLKMFGDPTRNRMNFSVGTIREVVREVKYGTSKSAESDGNYPYLRMNNITPNGYMDYSDLKYINIQDSEKEKYVVRKGDLLFNRTNSKELVGKTGIFSEEHEMIIAGYLIRVRTNEKANPWFLWGYLNSVHGKQTLLGMCKAIVGMANINAQELQKIKILIPPIELQNRFAEIVEKAEALKKQLQSGLNDLENLYGSLSQRAFKGMLDLSRVYVAWGDTSMPEFSWNEFRERFFQVAVDRVSKILADKKETERIVSDLLLKLYDRFQNQPFDKMEPYILAVITNAVFSLKNKKHDLEILVDEKFLSRNINHNLLKEIGDPFEVDEEVAKKQGEWFYKEWKKFNSKKKKSKLTWDRVSTEQVANWIKENYTGYHFTSEMLIRFLMDEHVTFPDYYSSEELKKNPKSNDADDLKTLIFSALNNGNPFLKLEQVFYNPELDNVNLTLRDEDFELIKNRTREQRTGVYLRIAK